MSTEKTFNKVKAFEVRVSPYQRRKPLAWEAARKILNQIK